MRMIRPVAVVAAVVLATSPALSQSFVYPAQGQSPEQQQQDEFQCHQWAVQQTGFDPTRAGPNGEQGSFVGDAAQGAVVGGVVGLGVGAIAGDAGKGAAIGAIGGGLLNGMSGDSRRRSAQRARDDANRQYQRARAVCLEGRGYSIR